MPGSLNLEKKILKTIIYFNLFNYPMTDWEIWKWLWNDDLDNIIKYEFFDVRKALWESEYLKEKLGFKSNFYFLKGRENLVRERLDKYVYAWQKFRKIKRIVRILKLIPFIKLIAVCNDLAYFNAPEESDIDFFIITARKRIWIARFLSVFIIKLLGLRPTEKNKKDKICLSIFVSEDNLNLEYLKISPTDIHFTYWLECLIPIYDADGYYQKLRQANSWINNYLPNTFPYEPNPRQKVRESKIIYWLKKLWAFFVLDLDEKFYCWLQQQKFPKKIKEIMNQDSRVVVNNQILKFHTNDNREEISLRFKKMGEELI